MNSDFYQYTIEMKAYLEKMEKRVTDLELELTSFKNQLKQRELQQPVTIEKIEYKFDQLKIERLDGTLNIGINPSELQELSDFTIDQKPFPVPNNAQERHQMAESITLEITTFIEQHLSDLISENERELGRNFEGQYDAFIKDDLYKQLHERIQFYLDQFPFNPKQERDQDYKERIIEQMKTDIEQAIRVFLQNLNE